MRLPRRSRLYRQYLFKYVVCVAVYTYYSASTFSSKREREERKEEDVNEKQKYFVQLFYTIRFSRRSKQINSKWVSPFDSCL